MDADNKSLERILRDWQDISVDIELLAQGEYNQNYIFTNPKDEKQYILRINNGSQIGLKNQIRYEYDVLKYLEENQQNIRTPMAYYCDDSKKHINKGAMVMEYIIGDYLDYDITSHELIVECLGDIHNIDISAAKHIIRKSTGAKDIINECDYMFSKYMVTEELNEKYPSLFNKNIYSYINQYMHKIKKMYDDSSFMLNEENCSIINTDLNSTNFLCTDNFIKLIDWEKPCIGDSAQDLGHFLAPTTTFWKTDKIFDEDEIFHIINLYKEFSEKKYGRKFIGYEKKVDFYMKLNCLRGITWCSMALMDYYAHRQKDKIYNESTAIKLKEYMINMEGLLLI